jgi:hypothetical protein
MDLKSNRERDGRWSWLVAPLLGVAAGILVAVALAIWDQQMYQSRSDYMAWRERTTWTYILWPAQVLLVTLSPKMTWTDYATEYVAATLANGLIYGVVAFSIVRVSEMVRRRS